MRYWFVLISLFTTLLLNAQQWYFWIDEYQPAQRAILQSGQQVLWVNNTLPQPADFGHSVMVDGVTTGNAQVVLDKAALHCLFTATQNMDASMEYARVELQEQSQNHSTNYYTRQPLTPSQLRSLCQSYDVDALVVLNQIVLYDVVESFRTDYDGYYAYMQAFAQSHWTVYDALTNKSTSFSYADTLLWESEVEYVRSRSLDGLPSREEALLYLSREVGAGVAESLTPQWVPTKRYLYERDNAHLQAGLDAFRYQRWQEAIEHWQLAIAGKDKKAAAMAAANCAIAYEMQNDYALAYALGEKALQLFGAWHSAYGRQQAVNMRYYLERLQAKMGE